MRLTKIKLAGFKSFVDPTSLEFNSPLVAIVGPNGCGKSNIIDAVRWVMGESSAKNLRGESMSDVIFNGSTTRKPVGQASIELVFDNSEGRLKGEYASYSEISIKRQATRDNQSAYFLNGGKCRRRDITEIFLGTGLGPRSYSIIEQGMISKVIEAKPEELRGFLEEAAGVSLYRRRRQETETRIRHTRENLSRVEDVRQELEKQLERLKRQSEAAFKYTQLKQEHDTLEGELHVLRLNALQANMENYNRDIRRHNTDLEEKLAARTRVELELEQLRQTQPEVVEAFQAVQSKFYQLGSEINRLEQSLEHHREREEEITQELKELEKKRDHLLSDISEDRAKSANAEDELLQLKPIIETARNEQNTSATLLQEANQNLNTWAGEYEKFQEETLLLNTQVEREKAKIAALDTQGKDAQNRLEKLYIEKSQLSYDSLLQEGQVLEKDFASIQATDQDLSRDLKDRGDKLQGLRAEEEQARRHLDTLKTESQDLATQLASKQALQAATLGTNNEGMQEWLLQAGVGKVTALGQSISVEPGFETAIETVLGEFLEAVCVSGSDLENLKHSFETFRQGSLTVIERGLSGFSDSSSAENSITSTLATNTSVTNTKAVLLNAKIHSDYPVWQFLKDVYVVDSLQQAFDLLAELNPAESVVTRDGMWLGKNWFRIAKGANTHQGVISRETEIKSLTQSLEEVSQHMSVTQEKLSEFKSGISAVETDRESLVDKQNSVRRSLQELSSKIGRNQSRVEHIQRRLAQIQEQESEENNRIQQAKADLGALRSSLQHALDAMEAASLKRTAMLEERNRLQEIQNNVQKQAKTHSENLHALDLKVLAFETQIQALKEGLTRLEQQKAELEKRFQHLQQTLKQQEEPKKALRDQLENLLNQRLSLEEDLKESKQAMENLEQSLRSQELLREQYLEEAEAIRVNLENLRMEWQAINVRAETILEKLLEAEQNAVQERVQKEKAKQAQEQARLKAAQAQQVILSPEGEGDQISSDPADANDENQTQVKLENTEITENAENIDQSESEAEAECLQEKLPEIDVQAVIAAIKQSLSPEATEEEWNRRLEQVKNRISRLGAINLAAIEEFQTESERKQYLDAQHQDLTEALETLENAIRKIDRESRNRFQEVFDKVNSDFQVLFPKLFGGGQAYLELIGDELLEAGVSVMARPPGKRNSSIHLLSGGEKALTAVAFVFSIFQLNPAPFCMLDEVDAPLDDANVGRFCELVKHMSQNVQFIFVTHNKISMEIADHLVGVTMKEAGVSRLVSVDVAEAFEMAQTATAA